MKLRVIVRTPTINHFVNQLCIHPLRNIYENIKKHVECYEARETQCNIFIVYTVVQDNLIAK